MFRLAPFFPLMAFAISITQAAEKIISSSSELQTALDAASPGDTIYLESGTYSGPFTITPSGTPSLPITLTTKASKVKITGSGTGLIVSGNHWQVKYLPLADFDTAVLLKGTGITLDGVAISEVFTGIDVQGQGNRIKNCAVEANKVGIQIRADNTLLESNSVKGSDSGITTLENTCCGTFMWNVISGGIKGQGQGYRSDGNVIVDDNNRADFGKPTTEPPHTFWETIKNFFSFLG